MADSDGLHPVVGSEYLNLHGVGSDLKGDH